LVRNENEGVEKKGSTLNVLTAMSLGRGDERNQKGTTHVALLGRGNAEVSYTTIGPRQKYSGSIRPAPLYHKKREA